jgi:hypothetical protein
VGNPFGHRFAARLSTRSTRQPSPSEAEHRRPDFARSVDGSHRPGVVQLTGHKTRAVFERYNIVSAGDLRDGRGGSIPTRRAQRHKVRAGEPLSSAHAFLIRAAIRASPAQVSSG